MLQFLLDTIYVYLYPDVNPIRATLIGMTSFAVLFIPYFRNLVGLRPAFGFLPIYSSAFFGALLVQNGYLASKSVLSGIAHIAISALTYGIIILIHIRCRIKQK
ncbi:hypothetical protein HYT54_01215 [Candidatus Woesearchaeota archaeon]|nr:hypothetical protein [Candidatus Woesearchaeota archaeon]